MPLTLTWKVGLLEPRFFIPDSPLKSDFFILEYLVRSKWTLQLVRTILDHQDSIAVGLANETDPDCGALTLKLTIDVCSDEDGEESLCIGNNFTFRPGSVHLFPYLQSEEMNESKRNVTFVCTIIEYFVSEPGMSDYESLSKDMKNLMKSSLYSDLTVFTNDNSAFKVHKFVLCSRWKEINSRINATENVLRLADVSGWIFKVFLKYLYTGKVKHLKASAELYNFVSRNCWDLKCALRCVSRALVSRSRLNTERKVLKWNVADSTFNSLPLLQLVPLYNIYTHEMIIALDFHTHESAEQPVLFFTMSFPNCNADRPILVRGDISLEIGSNVASHQEFSNVVLSESELGIPLLFSQSVFDRFRSYQLTVTLDIGDGYSLPVLESSQTYFRTVTPGVYDLHSLSKDLRIAQRDSIYSDLRLDTNRNERVNAHKALLGIRSERFKMSLNNYEFPHDRIWKLDLTSVPTEIMMHIIKYIYTGSVCLMSNEQLENVFVCQFAQYLRLHKLHAYCETYLGLLG